jgi:hypothetical protein
VSTLSPTTVRSVLTTALLFTACNDRSTGGGDDCYSKHDSLYSDRPHLDPGRLSLRRGTVTGATSSVAPLGCRSAGLGGWASRELMRGM